MSNYLYQDRLPEVGDVVERDYGDRGGASKGIEDGDIGIVSSKSSGVIIVNGYGEYIDRYFKAEVLPYVSDAWIDYSKTVVGYEISFTKYFYKFTPLRELDLIEEDIKTIMNETQTQLSEIL